MITENPEADLLLCRMASTILAAALGLLIVGMAVIVSMN
jgi:hypothetical protein